MKRDDDALVRLDDYVRGHDGEDATSYEDDLFVRALDGDAPELAFRDSIGATFHAMRSRGTLDPWITARDVARIVASGARALVRDLDLTNPTPEPIPPEYELLITRIPFDLTGVRHLEVEIYSTDGRHLKTMPDIAFDPADGAIFACCEAELARAAVSVTTVSRVWVTDDSGRRLAMELPVG